MNERGSYGKNGAPRVGQVPVYVERQSPSTAAWIIGVIAAGGAVLWARHQSRQIEQLQSSVGMPHQSFASSLREGARASLRRLSERVRPEPREPRTIALEAIELEAIDLKPIGAPSSDEAEPEPTTVAKSGAKAKQNRHKRRAR